MTNESVACYNRMEFREFGGLLERVSYALPEVTDKEVLIRMNFCGVCHSDVHIHEGFYNLGGGKKLALSDRGVKLPVTLGHEVVGTVVKVGDPADQPLVGKQFLVYPWIGCGECADCMNGSENLCVNPASLGVFKPGGYSEMLVVPDSRYLVDVTGVDPTHASMLACSGLTTYSAINKITPVNDNESVVVIGCGGLGQIAIKTLTALGIKNIYAVDVSSQKRELAEKSGASKSFDASDSDVAARIVEDSHNSCCAVLDFVGNDSTVALGLSVLKKGGRLAVVGLHGGELRYPIPAIVTKAVSIVGSYTGTLDEMKQIVELAKQHNLVDIPVEVRDLDQAGSAVSDLAKGKVEGRIILKNS